MSGLKIRQLNEGIINLAQIDIMSTTILVILILSLKKLFDISVNYETLTDKIFRKTNEIMKNIHTQRSLEQKLLHHCIWNKEEQPEVIRKPTLIYPVTMQEPNTRW